MCSNDANSSGGINIGATADNYYPTTNDWDTTISYLNSRMQPSHLSHDEGQRLLRIYLPQCVADAYCNSTTGQLIPYCNELIEALQTCPHLVLEETPINRFFLQLCGSETSKDKEVIYKAARKLATYWKIRKYFFQERAFLPMVQTSPSTGVVGALSEEDMEWLNLGFGVVLSAMTDPYKHRSVLVCNPQTLPSCHQDSPRYARIKIRISFYCMHLVTMNPVTQKEGVVLLQTLSFKPCLYYAKWCYWIIEEALPIKDFQVHYLLLPPKIQTQSVMSFVVSLSKLLVAMMNSFLISANFHFGYTDAMAIQKLANSVELNKDKIAPLIAGTNSWSIEAFKMWQENQMKIEEEKHKPTSQEIIKGRQRKNTERARQLDAARCRKKRERAKAFTEGLQDQVRDLQTQNRKLKGENVRLGKLLEYAQGELHVLDGLEDEALLDAECFPSIPLIPEEFHPEAFTG